MSIVNNYSSCADVQASKEHVDVSSCGRWTEQILSVDSNYQEFKLRARKFRLGDYCLNFYKIIH